MTDRASAEGLHETHICRDCGANITIPYVRASAEGLRERIDAVKITETWGDMAFRDLQAMWRLWPEVRAALRSSESDSGIDVEAIIRTLQSITHDLREVLSTPETD